MSLMKTLVEVTPSKLRQYFFEYAVIFLTAAIVTLAYMFNDLNKYIRNKQNETLERVTMSLDNSTNAIQQFLNKQKNY